MISAADSWLPFDEAVRDRTRLATKIQRSTYLTQGEVPVIDQGQEEIAGYTNDAGAAYSGALPVVLFGDHTRALKYVDRPFAAGADGVKVLEPCADLDPKFLWYYLRSITVPNDGYSRHFKHLRELRVPVPPLLQQRRVVSLLSRAESIVRMRREAEAKAKEIIPALFLEMFGDSARNPKEWTVAQVEDCCTLVRGSSPRPQGDPRYFVGPVPRLMIADITRDGIYVTPRIDSLTPAGAERSRPMNCGDVVMAVSGACGLPAILAVDACIHDGFVGFRSLSERIRAEYLYTFLALIRGETAKQAVGATFQNLKTDQIRAWKIPIPPIQLQDSFVDRANSLRRLGDDMARAATYSDSTFQSLLAGVFGEAQ